MSDFVFVTNQNDEESITTSNNTGINDFVLVDRDDSILTSNNTGVKDFLLVYESPVSARRRLRSSRELSPAEKDELQSNFNELVLESELEEALARGDELPIPIVTKIIEAHRIPKPEEEAELGIGAELAAAIVTPAATQVGGNESELGESGDVECAENDEAGAAVAPFMKRASSSYKNGRRLSSSAAINVPDSPTKSNKLSMPDSPCGVVDSFFGDLLAKSPSGRLEATSFAESLLV